MHKLAFEKKHPKYKLFNEKNQSKLAENQNNPRPIRKGCSVSVLELPKHGNNTPDVLQQGEQLKTGNQRASGKCRGFIRGFVCWARSDSAERVTEA